MRPSRRPDPNSTGSRCPSWPTSSAARTDRRPGPSRGRRSRNTYYQLVIRKGDIDGGWAQADVVDRGHLRAAPPGARLSSRSRRRRPGSTTQGGSRSRPAASGPMRTRSRSPTPSTCPTIEVRVIYAAIGGAFGGKEDMSLQIVLGLAARSWPSLGSIARCTAAGRARSRSSATTSATGRRSTARWAPPGREDHRGRGRRLARRRAPTTTPRTRCSATPTSAWPGLRVPNARIDSRPSTPTRCPAAPSGASAGPRAASSPRAR